MATKNLTIIFYTSNQISDKFMQVVTDQLLKAADGTPIISVSQKPMDFGVRNICLGDIGQNVWNIYHQMLIGAKAATTKYVATAEDDVLYSREHYHTQYPDDGKFMYDMNRWSLFTWKQPMFTYKPNRLVAHQMICERELLIEALEERFRRYPDPSTISIKTFGEPGRYEHLLKVTKRPTQMFWSKVPSVVFNHEKAVGFIYGHGKRKASGPVVAPQLEGWGDAKDVLEKIRG